MEGKQKVALTFALYQGEALVRRETVTQDIVKVGKDAKSHLRVDDELASRMHAVIEVASPTDITLIDLGNEPGTMVNGARVNKCKINPGDQLQIGGTKIVLERAEPVAVAAAAAPKPAGSNPFAAAPAPSNPFGAAPSNPFAAAPSSNPFAAAAPSNPFGAGGNDPFAFNNPFAQQAPAVDEVPHDAPEGSYTYTLVKSAPDVPAEEVEDTKAASVEVMILWDTMVLHVSHLTPPRSFYVGEEESKNFSCDYFIPSEKLGTTRAPIVLADRGGSVSVVLLPRAQGTIELPGQPKITLQQAIETGKAQPCAELSGAHQIQLPVGSKAKIELGGLVFQVSAVNAGRVVAGHFQLDTQGLIYTGLSFAVHAGLLAAMAFFMPAMGGTDGSDVSADQQYLIQQYLQAAAEKEMEQKETEQVAENKADNKEGGTGTRAKGEEGSMGNPNTKLTGNRYGVAGPKDNADPHIARAAALRDAAEFGMIGLLNSGAGGDPNAPTAPWGRDDSLGNDPLSARGNMWGNDIGESFGAGGLGLSGIGEGGGGRGEGIGLGSIGTLGHGAGTGTGQGFGSGHGRLSGSHRAKPPQVRMGATQVSGRLPPEVIQRIVRQNFGRFRLCYENGLRNNPNLQGRVSVRFVIGRDGAVSQVSNGGSDMPDGGVVSCVVRAFYGLSFPQPEGGIVTVTYPIMFSPGGGSAADLQRPGWAPRESPPAGPVGPYEGKTAEVMDALAKGDKDGALSKAIAFWKSSPGDVLALLALGEAFEARGEVRSAARAYGSIIDLFASRADLRRMAGERLERLAAPYAQELAADSFAKAAQQRPDHPASHRLLAYARLRAGDPAGAFEAVEAGAKRGYPAGRFKGVDRILREDMGLLGAAWIKSDPSRREEIERRLGAAGASLATSPSLRFVLVWETDNNDVDFHIHDAKGGHAFYSQRSLPSGGELYADVTTGYGPECFTVPLPADRRAGPYRLQAHYYSRGPMGYGMGKLEIIDHDGKGGLTFEERPFVVMRDRAYVELGSYPAEKPAPAPSR